MASTETLSRTPPIPPRNPFRRLSSASKTSPALPDKSFHIETELIPKPLFSRRTTLPSKTVHVVTVELPSPGLSPIILPSDTSTISSNRSSFVSVNSSRPSTAATSGPSESSSRAGSLTSASPALGWVPPLHVAKPLFGRSNTLPSRAAPIAREEILSQRPLSNTFPFEPSIKVPGLKLPPARTNCFSPDPVWTPPKRAPNPLPNRPLRRTQTPRKETLRSLRAKDSVTCLQVTPERKTVARSQTDPPKKTAPEKRISLSNMRTYSMDAKGVFILNE
ncbi:hypothetical protein HBI46_042530 [Parastagonospora nodorum]|nr:hypothetical protein HBI95_171720 [Parastagonospora nodorum]KAH5322853.1 hypothetical protein HBI11_035920 [Parastagonospora nodorum]KAH5426080.1 hypothetical protein HBI46_042530 [Parastagonospora nodorum]KAH5457615.1 hypothetical protein HBI30_061450 [Parastagonospora nodorum]KAH6081017.1 hypothetical protein HBI66_072660 [Parastagonospora nodorum]